jgi:hypothetical protein
MGANGKNDAIKKTWLPKYKNGQLMTCTDGTGYYDDFGAVDDI